MIKFNNLLDQLRSLGGIAKNIELRYGLNGRGIFAKDPNKAVEFKIPIHLLAPTEWLELDENEMLIFNDKCTWNEQKKCFFLEYQKHFGWSSVKSEIRTFLDDIYQLPDNVKNTLIKSLGGGKSFLTKAGAAESFKFYINSRRVSINKRDYLMPLFELINHDIDGFNDWAKEDSVAIKGKLAAEITTNYNKSFDALDLFMGYGFTGVCNHAYSGFLTIRRSLNEVIHIGRFTNEYELVDGISIPKVIKDEGGLKITFVDMYNPVKPDLPMESFSKLMLKYGVSVTDSAAMFEGIKSQNRKLYIQLLIELENHNGNLSNVIKKMACRQLIALA